MKKITPFLITLFSLSDIYAQAPEIEWQNTIGGTSTDELRCIEQTSDGGYILGGSSFSKNNGDKTEYRIGDHDYWIVKVNSFGIIEWDETLGGTGRDNLYSIQQTPDGGYIVGGYSFSNASGDKSEDRIGQHDYWVIKLNADGIIEWDQTIGGLKDDNLTVLQHTTDGGFILGGYSYSDISDDKTENKIGPENNPDYWVVKLNAGGIIEWDNTMGGTDYDFLYSLDQTSDGGYIIGGKSDSNESEDKSEHRLGQYDYWVVKLNAGGDIEWENTIGGDSFDNLSSIKELDYGGYIVGGSSTSDISDDKTQNVIGVVGDYNHDDYWIMKLNETGVMEWEKTIGGFHYDFVTDIICSSDLGIVIAGYSNSMATGDKIGYDGDYDYWIVKLEPELICAAPTGIYSDNITATSAKIHWDAGVDSTKYQINYRPLAGGVWQKKNSVMPFKNITGLLSNTTYEYKIKTICGDVTSPFSPLYYFTTLPFKGGEITNIDFVIYPNPAKNTFAISANIETGLTTIVLYNNLGQLIYTKQINSMDRTINEQFEIGYQLPGIYLVKLYNNNCEFVQPLVIE